MVEGKIAPESRTIDFFPTEQSTVLAQELYAGTLGAQKTERRLTDFGFEVLNHYRDIGMTSYDRPRAGYLAMRAMWRANIGPILHAIDIELAQTITKLQQTGQPLVTAESTGVTHFDRYFHLFGDYQGSQMAFLRASSVLSYAAATRFLSKVINDRAHWCWPLWGVYQKNYSDLAIFERQRRGFYLPDNPHSHVRSISVTSNITALSVIAPAARHASLWKEGVGEGEEVMMERVEQLGWLAGTSRDFFERYFPGLATGDTPVEACPFSHDESAIATGSIYRVRPLQKPWRSERWCPANMKLYSPQEYGYRFQKVSAAKLRLGSVIPIASETLGVATPLMTAA